MARLPKPLTAREARFVAQYRLHGNAALAAREAGYAAHQAKAIGWNVLRKPKIIAALRAAGIEIVLAPKKPGAAAPRRYARSYKRKGLTLLQERFVFEYLIDGNATQAAIRAGLPAKNPVNAGSAMLHHREVAQTIERERAAAAARLNISADRVKDEMARIAFADIGMVADWGAGGVTLKEKAELSPHDRAAVAELSSEKAGAQRTYVKMHSKQRALDSLAKLLGLIGPGAKTTAPSAAELEKERRDANAELRERLMRIARAGQQAAGEKKEEK
jgi:phage terminase small subunit